MNSISVLLVDDSPTFLRAATLLLHFECGNEVVVLGTAADGKEAHQRIEELHPQVVLLDLCMPEFSGLELIPQIKSLHPEVRIIVVTLMDAPFYKEAALAAGADDFVSKSRLEADLAGAVRRVAGKYLANHMIGSHPVAGRQANP